jgi:hypothetical protein
VAVAETAGVGVDFGATGTPLFHTNFFPLLMQVYFFPANVEVIPAFLQILPAFTAAKAFKGVIKRATDINTPSNFFTPKD